MFLLALSLLGPLVELEWEAPPSCPSAAAFEDRVRAQADVRAEADAPAVLTARVVIRERRAQAWELALTLEREGKSETRTFEGESCAVVAEVAATLVSLRVVEWTAPVPLVPEPAPGPEPTDPPAQTPAPREPRPAAEPAPVPQSASDSRSRRRPVQLGGWLGLHGGVAFGVSPGLGGAVAIDGGIEARGWRAGLAVHANPRRVHPHPNDPGVRGRFDLVMAEALGCGVPWAGPVEFPLCARIAAGGLRATAEGDVGRAEPTWGGWWGIGGSLAAAWHVSERFAPVLSAEALASLAGWSYSIGGVPGALHQTGAVALRGWAGVEIHL